MEKLLLPTIVKIEKSDKPNTAVAIVEPCFWGYGTTIGNALRRVLLSSLEGAAVTAVKIKGVSHEFSSIVGVKEDVVEILLNLKRLRLKLHTGEARLRLEKKGKGMLTALDITPNADVEIANPELVLATLTDDVTQFSADIFVAQGRGYTQVEERDTKDLELGTIAVDSFFNPIVNIGYKIENVRVGDVTDYERLIIDIETDGTVDPADALERASQLLVDHFTIVKDGVVSPKVVIE